MKNTKNPKKEEMQELAGVLNNQEYTESLYGSRPEYIIEEICQPPTEGLEIVYVKDIYEKFRHFPTDTAVKKSIVTFDGVHFLTNTPVDITYRVYKNRIQRYPNTVEKEALRRFGFWKQFQEDWRSSRRIEIKENYKGYEWYVKITSGEYVPFDVLKNGKKYCRGVVFSIEEEKK